MSWEISPVNLLHLKIFKMNLAFQGSLVESPLSWVEQEAATATVAAGGLVSGTFDEVGGAALVVRSGEREPSTFIRSEVPGFRIEGIDFIVWVSLNLSTT